jgi:hypothetical protein
MLSCCVSNILITFLVNCPFCFGIYLGHDEMGQVEDLVNGVNHKIRARPDRLWQAKEVTRSRRQIQD